MKLRIRANSVRIRLSRSEVARIGAGEKVQQTTRFSPVAILTSSVEPDSTVARPTAQFVASTISVLLPTEQARAWASSEQVTIAGWQGAEGDESLQILVEKDFECMHSRAEGNTDAFPNPRAQEGAVMTVASGAR
jgi:hypothetical protein